MRQIPLSFGLLAYLEELEHSEAALSADPDAKDLAAPFTEAIGEWDNIFKQERAARRGVIRAEAVVAVRDQRLDDTTMKCSTMVRAVNPALLGKLFTMAPGRFVRRGLRKQCETTRDLIVPELQKQPSDSPLKPFASSLDKGVKAALSALDERSKAKGARQAASNEIDEWKEGINALRTTTYAELLKLATEKGFGKAWVETFFRSSSSTSVSDEAAEPPETSEAVGSAAPSAPG
jgi:hypothetical protein